MKKIQKIETIIDVQSDWKPSDIAFIKYLEWSKGNVKMEVYSQLRQKVFSWPNFAHNFYEVSINFFNVSNFKLEFNHTGLQQISGFDIIDISDRKLENLNFQIEDYEDNLIGFSCQEIEILDFSLPTQVVFV